MFNCVVVVDVKSTTKICVLGEKKRFDSLETSESLSKKTTGAHEEMAHLLLGLRQVALT